MNHLNYLCVSIAALLVLSCSAKTGNGNKSIDNLPQTFLIKPDALMRNRQKIKENDPLRVDALTRLTALADTALMYGPYSVIQKVQTPPSGDKHDFMSQGPYWWPDPDKPDGLPYIRRDGETNPEVRQLTDGKYLSAVCSNVKLLAVGYFFTGNRQYAAKAAELLRVFFLDEATRMNPNMNYAQSIPGITDGRGIGMISMRVIVNLIDGIQILESGKQLTQSQYDGLQTWIGEFLNWALTSPNGIDEAKEHNNHGTYYDVQTVAMSLFLRKNEEAARILNEQTKKRIDKQLETDGRQPHELARTVSWGYAQMNLNGLFELALLAENVNIDLWNYVSPGGKSIKKAYLWMLPYAEGKPWEYKQIKPIDKSGFIELSQIAAEKYPDIDLGSILTQNKNETDPLFILTH